MPASRTLTPRPTATERRIGLVSTYPPRLCGLATFAAALERALVDAGEAVTVVSIGDDRPSSDGVVAIRPQLAPGDAASLRDAAAVLSECELVVVQHEYGVYGGPDGDEVLELLRTISVPTIVVLHTVPATPTDHQRFVLESVVALATFVVVMTAAAEDRLRDGYVLDGASVVRIPHGAWTLPAMALAPVVSAARPLRLLTWGLLGRGKGIEHVISALSRLDPTTHPLHYTVAGATHPNVLAHDGDRYRDSLVELARESGVVDAVTFDRAYRDLDSLGRLVRWADVVVLPYDSHDQVTSGVLVDAIAAGKPVIATAFPHAVEMLSDGAGIVVGHNAPAELAAAFRRVVDEPSTLASMSARAREIAPSLRWPSVADRYRDLCDRLVGVGPAASG